MLMNWYVHIRYFEIFIVFKTNNGKIPTLNDYKMKI